VITAADAFALVALVASLLSGHEKSGSELLSKGATIWGTNVITFGLLFWDEARNLDFRNQARHNRLEELNLWRNAIAHQDFNPATLGATTLRLQVVREWRRACDRLATVFDEVMRQHIESIVGASPW